MIKKVTVRFRRVYDEPPDDDGPRIGGLGPIRAGSTDRTEPDRDSGVELVDTRSRQAARRSVRGPAQIPGCGPGRPGSRDPRDVRLMIAR